MKTLKHWVHRLSLGLGLASCLLLSTGCKDTLELQSKWKQTKARLDVLKVQGEELESKLVDLRKVMPGGTSAHEAGRQLGMQAEANIKLLDVEIAKATTRLRESEAALAALKKQIANQGS